MKSSEIFIVIISFNGLDNLINTLNGLDQNVGHIHIVDNGSSTNTLSILRSIECMNNISIEYLGSNKGIGYALNIGIQRAKKMGYKWLLTMDQDSIADSNMISEFCSAININSNLCCLTPSINIFGKKSSFNRTKNKNYTIDYAITSGNLVKMSVFEIIGLYDEKLFIDCVDFDFSLRVRQAGMKINLVPNAKLYHQLGEEHDIPKIFSWFYTSHSTIRRYYMYRNWGYMIEQYSLKFPLFILKSSIIHILLLLVIPFYDKNPRESIKFIYYGVRDYFKNQYGPLKI